MKSFLEKYRMPDGGASGGEGGAAPAPSAQGAGEQSGDNIPHLTQPRPQKQNPLAGVKYGVQQGDNQQQTQQQAQRPAFDDLIKGEYKADYEAKIKAAIDARFRNQRDQAKELEKYSPIMQALSQKYGMDAGDVEGIARKLTDDDAIYAEAADAAGVPVATYKLMQQQKAQIERMQMAERQTAEENAMRAHFQKLAEQAQEMQKTFPGFDLMKEMENPAFARMTGPQIGVSVHDAYYAIHHDEIQKASMQYASQQAAQAVAASVQANGLRPQENGIQGGGMNDVKTDPRAWNKQDRAEIRRRVQNGEKIYL